MTRGFLESQFDARLERLLAARGSGIHHLESGVKSIIIGKKRHVMEQAGV